MSDIKTFNNERDLELRELDQFLLERCSFSNTVLDIGPWYEGSTKVCSEYTHLLETVDLVYRKALEGMVIKQYVGDYLGMNLPMCNFAICVSTLEHIGVTPLVTKDYRTSQLWAVDKMFYLASKGVFLTFPYGEEICYEKKYNNIDRTMVERFEEMAGDLIVKKVFWGATDPTKLESWVEIPQELADNAENKLEEGIRSLCVFSALKGL